MHQQHQEWEINLSAYIEFSTSVPVAPGFKNKTRYAPYVRPGSQFSYIATNKGVNIGIWKEDIRSSRAPKNHVSKESIACGSELADSDAALELVFFK